MTYLRYIRYEHNASIMRPLRFDQHKLDSRQNFYEHNHTSSENTELFLLLK